MLVAALGVGLLALLVLSAAPATTAAAADSANVTLYGPTPASLDDPAAIESAIENGTLRARRPARGRRTARRGHQLRAARRGD
ncbi:MAG: hypothetical protein U5J98_00560 [Halobacteriales archaeon]|nr:hypothetical protein [Halobacteriales archaeon]